MSLVTQNGEYSQGIAITQKALNNNLDLLFNNHPDISTIDQKNGNDSLKGDLKWGNVSLPVKETNLQKVNYHCKFAHGTATIRGVTIPLKDWEFVFEVDIDRAVLEPSSATYRKLKEKIGRPGNYQISSLYLKFNNSKKEYVQKLSNLQGHEWTSEDQKTAFLELIQKWKVSDPLKDPGKTTLSHVWTTPNPGESAPLAPSFPPTAVVFQIYPWKYFDQIVYEGLDKGGNNVLVFLEMVLSQSLPNTLPLIQTHNFLEPPAHGAMLISSKVFWDAFLLRTQDALLNSINEYSCPYVNSVGLGESSRGVHLTGDFGVGGKLEPDQYVWRPEGGGYLYGWQKIINKRPSFDLSIGNGDLSFTAETSNKIVLAGSGGIYTGVNIYGFTKFSAGAGIYSGGQPKDDFNLSYSIEWGMQIALKSTDKRRVLNLVLDPARTGYYQVKRSIDKEALNKSLQKNLEDDLNSIAETNGKKAEVKFNELKEKLKHALEEVALFVFPGKGTFFFKDPELHGETNDLYLHISYDGAE